MPARKPREPDEKPQIERFKEVARELECDEDPARFEEALRAIVRAKPVQYEPKKRRPSVAPDPQHASDCAVHNAPAYPPGPCTCGAIKAER
jgi:hypothetical protein